MEWTEIDLPPMPYVVTKTQQVHQTIVVPKSWWDHLKQTISMRLPRSLGRLVSTIDLTRIETSTTENLYICPHVTLDDPNIHMKWLRNPLDPQGDDPIADNCDGCHRPRWICICPVRATLKHQATEIEWNDYDR